MACLASQINGIELGWYYGRKTNAINQWLPTQAPLRSGGARQTQFSGMLPKILLENPNSHYLHKCSWSFFWFSGEHARSWSVYSPLAYRVNTGLLVIQQLWNHAELKIRKSERQIYVFLHHIPHRQSNFRSHKEMTAIKQNSPHFWSPDTKIQKASCILSLFIQLSRCDFPDRG